MSECEFQDIVHKINSLNSKDTFYTSQYDKICSNQCSRRRCLLSRYNLKPDVRQSLYDYCNQWTRAIGKDRKFMGGNQPNLADLVGVALLILTRFFWVNVECAEHQEVVSNLQVADSQCWLRI